MFSAISVDEPVGLFGSEGRALGVLLLLAPGPGVERRGVAARRRVGVLAGLDDEQPGEVAERAVAVHRHLPVDGWLDAQREVSVPGLVGGGPAFEELVTRAGERTVVARVVVDDLVIVERDDPGNHAWASAIWASSRVMA